MKKVGPAKYELGHCANRPFFSQEGKKLIYTFFFVRQFVFHSKQYLPKLRQQKKLYCLDIVNPDVVRIKKYNKNS